MAENSRITKYGHNSTELVYVIILNTLCVAELFKSICSYMHMYSLSLVFPVLNNYYFMFHLNGLFLLMTCSVEET